MLTTQENAYKIEAVGDAGGFVLLVSVHQLSP
jgi:hypothetical protein